MSRDEICREYLAAKRRGDTERMRQLASLLQMQWNRRAQ